MSDYSSIIDIFNWNPKNHPRMPLENRAAEFHPFSALTGYEEKLKDARRVVDNKKILVEDSKEILDNKIIDIKTRIKEKPILKITYFIEDLKKDGGVYRTITGKLEKIDTLKKEIILKNMKIDIDKIVDIEEIKEFYA